MQLFRVPPYPLSVSYDVPDSSTSYTITFEDMVDSSIIESEVTSNSSSQIIYSLGIPFTLYDNSYKVTIYNEDEEVVLEDFLDIYRPYVNPYTKGNTASEINAYAKNEELARMIIESVLDEDFYYKKKIIENTGLGNDYLPVWDNVQKVLRVSENNVLIWDVDNPEDYDLSYILSDDKTAIVQGWTTAVNRDQSTPLRLPGAQTDYVDLDYAYKGFPMGWDYKLVVVVGYEAVPLDIRRATELLVEDIECGKLDYYKRYIASYNTDQFRIQFDKSIFEGTGNLLVDKILSKYEKPIKRIGVL
jgi:hypothetical protein